MKYIKTILPVAMIAIIACNGGKDNKLSAKKDELANLKKQEAELKTKITALEKELTAAGEEVKANAVQVKVTTIIPAPFNHYVEIQGKIDGDENISLSAKMPGVVANVYVKEGDNVQRGQILAELDDQVLKQGIEELKSGLDFATTVYEKQKRLWDKKIGSEI